jgi:ABC-2 type transport system ATP-binding protein
VSAIPTERATSAVETRALEYRFGALRAVDRVSFEVRQGEVFGLLGPNGAGKTTTIRILTTLLRPMGGTAAVFGHDVRRERQRVRQLIGYVPQSLSADGTLSGYENVWLFARLFDVPRRERRARVLDSLAAMGLADVAGRQASTYSGGMIRRLELAQALVNRPRLLVLDEPTIGLDPVARQGVWERVGALREETGMTVVLTTHYMEEAEALCDRIALMHRGRLRAIGAPQALEEEIGATTLEEVFRHHTEDGAGPDDREQGELRNVRGVRRTFRRLG